VLTCTSWFTNSRLAPAVALLLLGVAPAYSQSQADTKPAADHLLSVSATGSKKFSSDQIAAASGLYRGSMITRDDIQAAANSLSALGVFKDLQYRFTSLPGGVKIEFQVVDAASVPIRFDNFPGFSDAELSAAIKASVPLFDGTAPEGGANLDAMDSALLQLLTARGVGGVVSHRLVTLPGEEKRAQQFRIESTALKVGAVEFSDALARDDRGIRERVADLIGKPYSRSAVELFEFEQVRPIYLTHAFLRVKFGPVTAGFTGNPTKPLPDSVVVYIPIEPGPAYTLGAITWSDNKIISSAELDKSIVLLPGQVANGNRLELTWEHVRDLYAKSGYLDTNLDIASSYDDTAGHVSFVVTITEGQQYRMGNLVITGLSLEGERRIRNAWNIARGAVFDRSMYDQFVSSGIPQAFVGLPVHYEKIGHFLETNPKTGTVEVLLDFQ
jgi:outer membrane protein assembly factor BamA